MHRVFIDGQSGTTGLQIRERLTARADLEILEIAPKHRKDKHARRTIIEAADVVLLCLPDDAAREAVALGGNANARFIDASTAHRIDPDWVYGLPEMSPDQRNAIASAKYVSNPGCFPTGFLTMIRPLIDEGILKTESLLSIHAISGYSGGGRQLIEKYEARARAHPDDLWHARPYALKLQHKHLPEMQRFSGLNHIPAFLPVVGHFHQGMLVSTPIFQDQLTTPAGPSEIRQLLADRYAGEPCVHVFPANSEAVLDDGYLDPQGANGSNRTDLMVHGNEERMVLTARLDNLGKGAAGAAVQNLNLMLQVPEMEGLVI